MTDDWQVGPYKLRPHQQKSVLQCRESLRQCYAEGLKPRVILQGVCGFGKTIISSYLMKQAVQKQKKPAFIVHGRQLVIQKSDKLCDAQMPHTVVMANCRGELRAAASPYKGGEAPDCSVISKDTYESLLAKGEADPFIVGLWIIDEAHSAKSDGWWKLIEQSPAPVVALTATPSWSNGLGMGDRYSKLCISATHEDLIAAGMIVPCRYFAPWGVDTRNLSINHESGEYVQDQIEARCAPLVGNFVEEWWKLAEGRRTVFYASSVSHSMAQAQAFREGDGTLFARKLVWEHVDAETPQGERKRIFAGIRDGDIDGVSNYGVLRQGFDCPAISCVQLGVAMSSLVAFLQSVGRGARPHPGKSEFIVIDHGHNTRHGWPQADREWRLDERRPIWQQEQDDAPRSKDRKCKNCGAVYPSYKKSCPECGHTKVTTAEMVRTVAGELIEIEPQQPQVSRNDKISDEQKAWEKVYFPSSKSKSPMPSNFKQLRAQFHRKNPHLRIVENGDATYILNLHTRAKTRLGYAPAPHSPHWDMPVRSVPRESLQQPTYFPTESN